MKRVIEFGSIVLHLVLLGSQCVWAQGATAGLRIGPSFSASVGHVSDGAGLGGILGEAALGLESTNSHARYAVDAGVLQGLSLGAGVCSRSDGQQVVEEPCEAAGAFVVGRGDRFLASRRAYFGARFGLMGFREKKGVAWGIQAGVALGRSFRLELGHRRFADAGLRSTVLTLGWAGVTPP